MTKKAELGEKQVAPPLGYRIPYTRALPEIVPQEAEIVKLIFNMFLDGISVFGIARHLTDCGITGKRGGRIWSTAIKRMLENPYYACYSRWNGITYTFQEVQKRLKKTDKPKYSKPEELSRHWLSGIVHCSSCGKTMTSQVVHSPKRDYIIFQCGGYARGVCKVTHHVREHKLENAVLDALKEILRIGTIDFVIRQSNTDGHIHVNLIQSQIKNVNSKLDRIKNSYMAGIDTLEKYKVAKTALLEELCRLEKQSEQMQSGSGSGKAKEKMLDNIRNVYNIVTSKECDTAQKNSAIKSIIEKVIYLKEKKHVDIFYYLDLADMQD